ncbi:1-aminocyclopropane-1-carboxylate oxidase homolog 2-like isoform X1 [Papaver somniferum]|uniref:1-aminocyclopropane-1-carboxylate oxidase homolog 2-like isoform X1 n=1 Tax=Papaver somniferum TaxID=3469 RepID=UPI000E6FC6EB|nr:1-aminocyclopropane-1-carboxylate oxidase homolog 2-like isoform X1 [Papaver somniferum]
MEEINHGGEFLAGRDSVSCDHRKEMKAFDDAKAGVKGVVDAGALSKIPRIFVRPQDELAKDESLFMPSNGDIKENSKIHTPVIDLKGVLPMNRINDDYDQQRHKEIVSEIRHASETWGFFQLINHGIPRTVMDEMMEGVKRFHEQDVEAKKPLYSRDPNKTVVYFNTHFHFHKARYAEWKDSLVCRMLSPDPIDPEDLPETSRDIMLVYTRHLICLGGYSYRVII